jgi:hypothetical protein
VAADKVTWRDRYPEEVACIQCLEVRDVMELDRLLWCDRCRLMTRHRAGWLGWLIGLGFGAAVAAYVWLVIRPSDLVIGGWIATVVAAVWIGSKVGREIAYGTMRYRNRGAVDASPPVEPPLA